MKQASVGVKTGKPIDTVLPRLIKLFDIFELCTSFKYHYLYKLNYQMTARQILESNSISCSSLHRMLNGPEIINKILTKPTAFAA